MDHLYWEWSILDDITPTNAYDNFLNLLSGKYDALKKIGSNRDHISIWRYYTYAQECSLEISPEQMKKMGDQGVTLCISCWQGQ